MRWSARLTPLVAAALTAKFRRRTGFVLRVAAMPYPRPVGRYAASFPALKKAA
jgi:hypothetical protein